MYFILNISWREELMKVKMTAEDIMKIWLAFVPACPFQVIAYFFTNMTIRDTLGRAPRLHIVDFGIQHGFSWPCLLETLARRPGGPPMVRISGIDVPLPGFRPADGVVETGHRLADYAKRFNVPFEFIPVTCSKWETIQVDDLNIRSDEVLAVTACFQFRHLADESMTAYTPRDTVLKTIKEMNPDVFIHADNNGVYNSPFFITRFRKALLHWSNLFNMLETIISREQPRRMLLERYFYGREILNVLACEGTKRIERPKPYRHWQIRIKRAGFLQLPLIQRVLKMCRDMVQSRYHMDFLDESQFLVQGWKGRILQTLFVWKPS